jgi:hypothetical protein
LIDLSRVLYSSDIGIILQITVNKEVRLEGFGSPDKNLGDLLEKGYCESEAVSNSESSGLDTGTDTLEIWNL